MADKDQITPEKHRKQIEAFLKELPHYKTFAEALKRCLETESVHVITAAERLGLISTTTLEPAGASG